MSEEFGKGLIGHQVQRRLLHAAVQHPAPAYLCVGPRHVGKRTLATQFVRELLGVAQDDPRWQAHPDCIQIDVPEGKTQVSVEQIRDVRERIVLRPARAARLVVYVPHADRLNEAGTNALLKIVEEPPAGAVFVFVAEDLARIPGTLQSRSVLIPFSRVATEDMQTALIARGFTSEEAQSRAKRARGIPGCAIDPSIITVRGEELIRACFTARTTGARLARIEELAKSCEAEEDTMGAWKEALLRGMVAVEEELERAPDQAVSMGIALIAALRLVGGAVSPRVPLEACVVQWAIRPTEICADLQSAHVPRAFSALYSV